MERAIEEGRSQREIKEIVQGDEKFQSRKWHEQWVEEKKQTDEK